MKLREELELPINFSGNWIPKEFYYIDGLNGSDRELLSMILHLNTDGKGCTASNKYLSNVLGVSERQVINSINKLEKLLLIEKTLTNNTYRRLKLSSYLLSPIQEEVAKIEAKTKENNRGEESFTGGMKKVSQGYEESFTGGVKETSHNNKDNNKDNNKKDNIYTAKAEEIYSLYPRKVGKKKAINKIIKYLKAGTSKEELIKCVERYSKEVQGRKKEFIKNADTFFNGYYEDYLDCNYEEPISEVDLENSIDDMANQLKF